MSNEIELISDGDGIAVIGEPKAVERFLEAEALPSKDLGLPRIRKVLTLGTVGAQAAADVAANSGRWVKLTEESAQKVRKFGLTPTKTPGVSHAMIGRPGASKSWIQLEKGPGMVPKNPAVLANAPALMAQLAMQQAMDEISDYLAAIDAKLDDVLRAQKDTVLAQMIGIGLQIEEAMTIRAHVGRVSEVTWSKVQDAAGTIADTQAYALLQFEGLAEKLERKSSIADLMKAAQEAETKAREWLAVLARCFQLQEGIAVLELDRVLETAPDDLEGHRQGLKAARHERLDFIARSTNALMDRIQAAAERANTRVLFNPMQSPAVVQSSTRITASIIEFHQPLGIETSSTTSEAKRWADAAKELRHKAVAGGAERVESAKRLGGETVGKVKSAKGKVSARLAERRLRRDDEKTQSDADAG
ncbi:MAG: hypothetical protein PIR53_05180 [Nocardioides alkalitolerans]